MADIELVPPGFDRLDAYVAALRAGWSPNTTRDVTNEELADIEQDPATFLARLRGEVLGTVRLADGREVPRLPGLTRWIWDGDFCGSINLRFQPGTEELPSYVSGHVGYAVVPWKRRRGYATQALALLLPLAREFGLARVLATCDEGNTASVRVIERNGGRPAGAGLDEGTATSSKLRFWIPTVIC